MTASRNLSDTTDLASNTACPPRPSSVAGDARRRGQACSTNPTTMTAFGAALTTPARRASVDNAQRFSVIVDA